MLFRHVVRPPAMGALAVVPFPPALCLGVLFGVSGRREDGPATGVAVAARWRPKTARVVVAVRSILIDRVSAAEIKTSCTFLLN